MTARPNAGGAAPGAGAWPGQAQIRPDVCAMQAYAVQDARGLLKLDAMENPFGLPPDLQQALGERLGAVALNRYPGASVDALKAEWAATLALPPAYGLVLGNGSDELISLLALACAQPGAGLLAPQPGFVMYAMSARLQGLAFHGVDLLPDFALDLPAMAEAMRRHRPAITYLAYPNNPCATLWQRQDMRHLIAMAGELGGLVVVDEAYQPFSSHSWLDEIRADPGAHRHVLLLRTLSKMGLAGVRLGALIGPSALVDEFEKLRPPYNVSSLNAECGRFALAQGEVFAAQAAELCRQRDRLLQALAQLPGCHAHPSQANMVLLRLPVKSSADAVFQHLKAQGVLVKNVSKMHPLLHQCLRLTVGTAADNQELVSALQSAL